MAFLGLITLSLISPTAYLLYVRLNKVKQKAVRKNHPVGSPNYESYRMLYGDTTLATFVFLSTTLIINLLVSIYKHSHPEGSGLMTLLAFISTVLPLGLYIAWLWKNRDK